MKFLFMVCRDNYAEYNDDVHLPFTDAVWISFMVLGAFFFTVGCIMLRKLRMYFKDFYKLFGVKLWLANVFLTLPLFFRGILDMLMR